MGLVRLIETGYCGGMTRPSAADPEQYLTPKRGAHLAGISVRSLYTRLRGPNPPPFKRRGKCYLLPIREFTEWAMQDCIE
jgi:hypothetical protein